MIDLGIVRPGSTIRIPFSSFDKDDGSSITMTNFAAADILVYKDGGTTERASTAGFTATTDFDAKTGKHMAIIDLADNTTADFFKAGSEYHVAIDAVTVDTVTTGGWVARFRIGQPGAWFDTGIATLASQTSFTLTAGPAEDDALNDHWAIIHDVASAVQCARVQILDYTGSTKTVTLAAGATFTVAAGDNISIMGPMPMQPATTGRKPVVDSAGLVDANMVKAGPTGSGTAQTAGDIIGDTNDIQARLPAALVGGRIDANVGAISSDATAADNAEAFFDGTGYAGTGNVIPTVTTLTGHTPNTGDPFTRLGAPVGASISADIAAAKANLVSILALVDTEVQLILDRIGAFTGTGVNTILGFFKAVMRKDASNPSDLGGTYDAATDSLEFLQEDGAQLRDFGIMQVTTIATLASQTSFTLTAGSANDDAYNGCPIMITDSATEEQKCGGIVDDYTGSTKTITLKWDPAIFTMAVGDNVTIKLATDAPGFKKGKALANFEFVMIDSTDDISGKTGVTVTAERSIDGAAFGACTNSPAEVANGVYKIALSASDLAGNVITLKFTGTGCNATLITLVTEP